MKSFKQRLFLLNCIALDKGWMTEEQFAASRPKDIVGEVEIVYREYWVKARVGHFEINYRNDAHHLKKKWVDAVLMNVPKRVRRALSEHEAFGELLKSRWHCQANKSVVPFDFFRENYERDFHFIGKVMASLVSNDQGKLNGQVHCFIANEDSALVVIDRSLTDGKVHGVVYVSNDLV